MLVQIYGSDCLMKGQLQMYASDMLPVWLCILLRFGSHDGRHTHVQLRDMNILLEKSVERSLGPTSAYRKTYL